MAFLDEVVAKAHATKLPDLRDIQLPYTSDKLKLPSPPVNVENGGGECSGTSERHSARQEPKPMRDPSRKARGDLKTGPMF